jgi:ankyrin repeat protein
VREQMPMKQSLQDILQKYQTHPEFLGLTLDAPNQRGALDDSPLHIAAREGDLEDVEVLIDHGADVNLVGDLGNTPLHQAAMTGKTAVVLMLLNRGANALLENEFSQTALDVAQLGNHAEVVKALEKRPRG